MTQVEAVTDPATHQQGLAMGAGIMLTHTNPGSSVGPCSWKQAFC